MTSDEKKSLTPSEPPVSPESTDMKDYESIPEPYWARKKHRMVNRFFRGILYFILFSTVLLLVVLIGIGVWIKRFYDPIDMSRADKTRLAGWIVLRDFANETPETRSKLAERYFDPLQRIDKVDFDSPAVKKFIPYAKEYAEQRNKKVAEWDANKVKRSFARTDYRIVPSDPNQVYIAVKDIEPTPNLTDYLDQRKKSKPSDVRSAENRTESNIRVLTKEWFLQQMTKYEDAAENEKASSIEKTASELNHLSYLYNSALAEMGLPNPTRMEQIRDLHFMTDVWFDDTPPEELARLLWFKDLILSVFIAQQTGTDENIDKLIRLPVKKTKTSPWKLPLFKGNSSKESSPDKKAPPQNESPLHSDASSEGDPTDFF